MEGFLYYLISGLILLKIKQPKAPPTRGPKTGTHE